MLSPADMLIIGTAALLFFGPDQLPKVARRAGQVVREVQATSQSFIREMERAADEPASDPYRPPSASASYNDDSQGWEPSVPAPSPPETHVAEPYVSEYELPMPPRSGAIAHGGVSRASDDLVERPAQRRNPPTLLQDGSLKDPPI